VTVYNFTIYYCFVPNKQLLVVWKEEKQLIPNYEGNGDWRVTQKGVFDSEMNPVPHGA